MERQQEEFQFSAETQKKKGQIIVGIIENNQNQILLILRKKEKVWAFPSGIGATYKYNETPQQAIHSEVRYDTKLEIESVVQLMEKKIEGDKKADAMIAFKAKVKEGQGVILNDESALDFAWVSVDDPRLEELPFDQPEAWEAFKKTVE